MRRVIQRKFCCKIHKYQTRTKLVLDSAYHLPMKKKTSAKNVCLISLDSYELNQMRQTTRTYKQIMKTLLMVLVNLNEKETKGELNENETHEMFK